MSQNVYITRIATFLPNRPVSNDEMEDYLGMIGGVPSKGRVITLMSNGIKSRYYALNKDGSSTHTNAGLTAEAVRNLYRDESRIKRIEFLACGTSSPDQLIPSHASMVHGLLGISNIELASFSGACLSGINAIKAGMLSLSSGNSSNAVCTGSELLSRWMLAHNFDKESETGNKLRNNPYIAFEKDFLRWMLSDGAGAVLLEKEPGRNLSLKIEWLDIASYANETETCMYAGAEKNTDGSLHGFYNMYPEEWLSNSVFSLKQDVRLLRKHIVNLGMKFLREVVIKRNLDIGSIDHFLPHLSSEFFRKPIEEKLKSEGMEIPQEKWYTNLTTVGNVGAASAYLMLEGLINSGLLKVGQKILLMVPESARFSYAYALFTVTG